jgi:DNA-binding NarL/FixJ family response regulator
MNKIRLLHIDDHKLFTEGIQSLLLESPFFEWVGGASSSKEGIEKALKLKPDLILMDYFLQEENGVETGKEILKFLPQTKLVLLTMEDSYLTIMNAQENGFSAWISKASEKVELLSKIKKVAKNGENFFPDQIAIMPTQGNYNFEQLTKREKEIVLLVTQGFTSQEIADKLFLSLFTINTHRRNLLSKLGIKNFAQLSGKGILK